MGAKSQWLGDSLWREGSYLEACVGGSSLRDVLTPQIIPDKVQDIFRFSRWSAHFSSVFQNVRRSRAGSEP